MKEEITLKDLILGTRSHLRFILSKWYIVLLVMLLCAGYLGYLAYVTPQKYVATLTFTTNNEDTGVGGVSAILGNIGVGSSDAGAKAAKLMAIGKSRKVIELILHDTILIGEREQLIGDAFIDAYQLREDWAESPELTSFSFESSIGKQTITYAKVLKRIKGLMINDEDGILNISNDIYSGVFTISAASLHEDLSIAIVNSAYTTILDYYVTSSISGKEATLELLRQKSDSLEVELAAAEAQLARLQDRFDVILNKDRTTEARLSRRVTVLATAYAEVVRNRETSAFLLESDRPAFVVIDTPLKPLSKIKSSVVRMAFIGLALGVILGFFFTSLYKFYRDAMSDDLELGA